MNQSVSNHNTENNNNIIHRHLTFDDLLNGISEVIDDRDYEIQDVLADYREYCYSSGLIPDDWKRMRVQLAGTTIDINMKLSLYYDNVERGFSGHKYLGLYSQKAVRAVGEIIAIVIAEPNGDKINISIEKGTINDDMIERIKRAIEDAKKYGYDLSGQTRYFFVDKFYETFFEKTTPYAPMGSRVFDLCEVLGMSDLPKADQIAELLRQKKWS